MLEGAYETFAESVGDSVSLSLVYADERPSAPFVSTSRDSIALTIYDQNFALVTENRPLSLKAGANEAVLYAVSPMIDPNSVLLGWDRRSGLRPEILAHGYDMGVQGTDALLRRYIGKSVRVRRYDSDGKFSEELEGTLLSVDERGIVVAGRETVQGRLGDGLYVNPHGVLVLPADAGDSTLPALRVQVQSSQAGEATLRVSYMIGGLDWDADYVMVLRGDSQVQLQLWATVTNQTGLSGSVRVYELSANGTLQYLGAGNLPATPSGGRAEISYGRAFDLTGEWLPLKQTARAKGVTVYEVQITLRNAKAQPTEVQVVQPFNGAWRILQSSHSHTRLSATAAQWTVKVPARGSAQVRFTVEVRAL